MSLADEIADMTVRFEIGEDIPNTHEVYTILLRAMIDLRIYRHRIRTLEDQLTAKGQ